MMSLHDEQQDGKKDETFKGKRLAKLFEEGQSEIQTKRSENLFRQLDSRKLTEEENDIIRKRVELQQKMLEAYEAREEQRKISELRVICPGLTDLEGSTALELCNGSEEEAALLLSSDPGFLRALRAKQGSQHESTSASRNGGKRNTKQPNCETTPKLNGGKISVTTSDGVYVGRFQSRLGPYQIAHFNRNGEQTQSTTNTGNVQEPESSMAVEGSKKKVNNQKYDEKNEMEQESSSGLSWGSRKVRSQKRKTKGRHKCLKKGKSKSGEGKDKEAGESGRLVSDDSETESDTNMNRSTDVGKVLSPRENRQHADCPNQPQKEMTPQCIPVPRGLGARAISSRGHTCRGRVRQKAQKKVELVEVGRLKVAAGWFNAGYIFPEGFKSWTEFRSSVSLYSTCVHECEIIGMGGEYHPHPTFVITAYDRPDEPLTAKSCTGCWSLVLKRINSEISRRIEEGENLPPPPKTAIAGPEYFGLVQGDIVAEIEALDPDHHCESYWCGKEDRQVAKANLGNTSTVKQGTRVSGRLNLAQYKRNRQAAADAVEGSDGYVDSEDEFTSNKWAGLGRSERYKRRCANRGGDGEDDYENDDNPLANFMDPITLEPVVVPAISPYGHVMGLATWKAVLGDHRRCPFTKQPLSHEQCTVLTSTNFEKHRDRITFL